MSGVSREAPLSALRDWHRSDSFQKGRAQNRRSLECLPDTPPTWHSMDIIPSCSFLLSLPIWKRGATECLKFAKESDFDKQWKQCRDVSTDRGRVLFLFVCAVQQVGS